METTIINTSINVYCIKFQNSNIVHFFNNNSNELATIAKDNTLIEYIKIFQSGKFNVLPKKRYLAHFDFNTENDLYLQKYFAK